MVSQIRWIIIISVTKLRTKSYYARGNKRKLGSFVFVFTLIRLNKVTIGLQCNDSLQTTIVQNNILQQKTNHDSMQSQVVLAIPQCKISKPIPHWAILATSCRNA